MRILLVHPGPDFSVHDVYTGWYEALTGLGCEVAPFNMNDRLLAFSSALVDTHEMDETGHPLVRNMFNEKDVFLAAMEGLSHALYTLWPDVVLFVSGFYINAGTMQLIRSRNHKIVTLMTESPYEDDRQMTRAQLSDLVLLNDPTNIEMFREVTQAEYMPHAYRPVLHHPLTGPRDPALESDLCFIGTAFKSRVAFFEAMVPHLDGVDVLIGGGAWHDVRQDSPAAKWIGTDFTGVGAPDCVDNEQGIRLYQHAKCGINLYRRETNPDESWEGTGWSMGPREVEMAATGLFFLRDSRPESDQVFGKILPSFTGPEDASEKLRWYLAQDELRNDLARRAREAIADRTFTNNAKWLLGLLDQMGAGRKRHAG